MRKKLFLCLICYYWLINNWSKLIIDLLNDIFFNLNDLIIQTIKQNWCFYLRFFNCFRFNIKHKLIHIMLKRLLKTILDQKIKLHLLRQSNFPFTRMNINIHQFTIHRNIQNNDRISILRQIIIITLNNIIIDLIRLNNTIIQKDIDCILISPRKLRMYHISTKLIIKITSFDLKSLLSNILAIYPKYYFQ